MSGTDSETSYPPELLRVEETVKNKYLGLVRNLSFLELKQFNKMTYAEMVYEDMSKLLPNFDQTRLKETSHYVSNSLNTEAQLQVKRKSRGSSNANEKETDQVSSSFLKDLDTTMNEDQSGDDETENTDDNDSADELDDDNPQTQVQKLDDSVTQLKQFAGKEPSSLENKTSATEVNKCCKTCILSSKSKKKVEEIGCCFCMTWYHEQCVGIGKGDSVGIWICKACREVPQIVQVKYHVSKTMSWS